MTLQSRRQFLGQAAALAATGPLALNPLRAAALQGGDYRALVCVFFYGGNDSNNMVVPTDAAGYAAYAKARGNAAAGGLSLQQSSLALLNGASVGLHGALAPLADIWNQGHLAIQANVGTLVRLLTKSQFNAAGALQPPNLFSHSDQQMQWQQGVSGSNASAGWGGRVADLQANTAVPMVLSVSGNNVFMNGITSDDGTAWELGYAYAKGKHLVGVYTDWRLQHKFQVVNLMLECSLHKLVRSLDELQVYLREKA